MGGNGDRQRVGGSNAPPRMQKVAEARLPTEIGEFRVIGFQDMTTGREYVVLAKGDLSSDRPCLVRIHSQCLTGDVFHSIKCDCGRQLRRAMELIEQEGVGVLIYQQQEGRGIGLLNKIRAYELQDQGLDTVEANLRLGFAPDERSYEDCVAILRALGIRQVRLLSNNPHKIAALRKAGLCIVERVPLEVEPTEETITYLRAKKEKLGHLLSSV
ncbi:MAG: GTP cyclohydrolase II [Acidobacteriota bacterium]|nr:GTP cyclohydrolase II [Acidobacteriota bacterium]MDW8257189.1 GTP cyclohydrolase II [Acidobacteriota bacterium]